MRLSRRKILALCMSGALVLSSIPGMYIKSVAAKKSDSAVIKLNTTNVKLVKGKKKTLKAKATIKQPINRYINLFNLVLLYTSLIIFS